MPEKTKTREVRPFALPAFAWWGLAVLVAAVYFYGLGMPFVGPDEPRYAQVGREMFESGDLITPTLGGHNWFEKPVLLYWLEIAGYKVFGVREFAARLGSALCGLGTIGSLYVFGRSVGDAGLSRLLALMAASTLSVIAFSHAASFDIVLTFSITASLVSFFVFDTAAFDGSTVRRRYVGLVSFYVFAGFALLAKGLIGLVFPVSIVAVYYIISRRRPGVAALVSTMWGTLLAVAVASIWYVPMIVRYGREFVEEFIVQQQFQRFLTNKYLHPQPFYFYLWVLPIMTLPWLPFFLASIIRTVRNLATEFTEKKKGAAASATPRLPNSPTSYFALAWLIVPLLFFSLSGSKLPGYILPAVPAAMVLSWLYMTPLVSRSTRSCAAIMGTAAITLAAALLAMILIVPKFAEGDSVRSLLAAASERGYKSDKILTLHIVSHGAEFYAAGRLIRNNKGEQLRLEGVPQVVDQLKSAGGTALVLVPVRYVSQLTSYPGFATEVIGDNGDLAIAHVELLSTP